MPETMQAIEVPEKGEIEVVEKPVPEPADDEVLIQVQASGVCHSDVFTIEGHRDGIPYPITPGHEVVGIIEATGSNVDAWSEGDQVGVGWHGGHCFTCDDCRRGRFTMCPDQDVTGVTRDGGHAEYMTAQKEALAAVPERVDPVDAAPMMCAGVTTFNGLRHTDASPGDLVAIIGIGGLGHLALQYATTAGYETVAIEHDSDKENYAKALGADHFIDSSETDPAETLNDLGGADVILNTAPAADAIEQAVGGLGTDGDLTIVGVPEREIEIDAMDLIGTCGSISGWSTGHARDSQDTLEYAALHNIRAETETFDLEDYEQAYQKMMDGDVRFRAVITP